MASIYFAASIHAGRQELPHYQELIDLLHPYQIASWDAADAELFEREAEVDDRFIHNKELEELQAADVMLAEITIPSLGVGYQIAKAESWGKPVLCLHRNQPESVSAMINGSSRIEIARYHTVDDVPLLLDQFLIRHGFLQMPVRGNVSA